MHFLTDNRECSAPSIFIIVYLWTVLRLPYRTGRSPVRQIEAALRNQRFFCITLVVSLSRCSSSHYFIILWWFFLSLSLPLLCFRRHLLCVSHFVHSSDAAFPCPLPSNRSHSLWANLPLPDDASPSTRGHEQLIRCYFSLNIYANLSNIIYRLSDCTMCSRLPLNRNQVSSFIHYFWSKDR